MPVRGIEIFNSFPHQSGILNAFFDRSEFIDFPQLFRVSREPPTSQFSHWLILPWIGGSALIEIINQMHDGMCCAHLPRKAVVSGREHVPIKSKSKFHELRSLNFD